MTVSYIAIRRVNLLLDANVPYRWRHQKFWFFFQKLKKLWQLDILTKFEDNWTSRTAVSIGVAILPPPLVYEVEIAPSE